MTDKAPTPNFADLERQSGIPADKYCGLTPEAMSRVIVGNYSYSHAK